jgi:hypothetical protein
MEVVMDVLHDFFGELVAGYFPSASESDKAVSAYVTDMLARFGSIDGCLAVKTKPGRPVLDVGEMLIEADPVFGSATSFEEERRVRQHIGDYTLFYTGMYPENVTFRRRQRHRLAEFADLVRVGRESYSIVSRFNMFEHAKDAPVFATLASQFESCVYHLNQVRKEIDYRRYAIE